MNNLNTTKKKLTIIFTGIVFIIILILGLLFFTGKYFNEIRIEKINFSRNITLSQKRFKTIDEFVKEYNFRENILKKREDLNINNNNKREKNNTGKYLIIKKEEGLVISSNIDFHINEIKEIILNDKYYDLLFIDGFLISKKLITENDIDYNLIFIKKLNYRFENYINDIISFIFLLIILGASVYFIGYNFISRVLKPIEENINDMKYFIQNAGHELKTPISVIDSNIQLMDETKLYNKDLTKEIREEIKRMNTLMNGLTELTNINQNKELDNIKLEEKITEVINAYKKKKTDKNINININIQKNIIIKANKEYFYIFISNILGNAIKYNKKGGDIEILYKKGELTIRDSGIGIEKENIDKIFNRFYKEDNSRNTEGFGIGLSLVHKIANIYKWTIKIKSVKNKGTTFIIKFK